MARLFGTDGIRGVANIELKPTLAYALGRATAHRLADRGGAIVVATGFTHFDPGRETQMYGYYEYEDVITLVDAEKMMSAGKFVRPSTGEPPKAVCFIQCVGSRDRRIGNEYCSKVCCGVASKEAIEIRRLLPDAKVYIFYIDMRMYGYWENAIYWPAQEQYNVNYIRGIVTEIVAKEGRLLMKGEDTTMGRPLEVLMDVIVLSVGMAVDANVLINERIREELRWGDTPHAAIQAGYERAWGTILDSNVTTLIAGIALARRK